MVLHIVDKPPAANIGAIIQELAHAIGVIEQVVAHAIGVTEHVLVHAIGEQLVFDVQIFMAHMVVPDITGL